MDNAPLLPFEKAYKIISRRADNLLHKAVGCSRREMWVLVCVDTVALSQREVGDALGLHPNVVVKLLDGMQTKGLLQRVRRADDRREQIVEVTPKGKEAIQQYTGQQSMALREVFHPLTDEQIRQWLDFAEQIVRKRDEGPA